jgi:hypothetical protein
LPSAAAHVKGVSHQIEAKPNTFVKITVHQLCNLYRRHSGRLLQFHFSIKHLWYNLFAAAEDLY